MSKFVIRNVASGVKFDLKASNGETILTSEVYTTEDLERAKEFAAAVGFNWND